jgi:Zn finger protein HypA/HybF involved in hydrogenase expression
MTPSELIFAFLFMLLAGWAVVAFYTRRPESDFTIESSGDQVFRCEDCDYVYTDDADVERSLCPECGRMNNSVQF